MEFKIGDRVSVGTPDIHRIVGYKIVSIQKKIEGNPEVNETEVYYFLDSHKWLVNENQLVIVKDEWVFEDEYRKIVVAEDGSMIIQDKLKGSSILFGTSLPLMSKAIDYIKSKNPYYLEPYEI